MNVVQKRWIGFVLLVVWGLTYIAVFAYLKMHSRNFLLSGRLQALCSQERCPRSALPYEVDLTALGELPPSLVTGWGRPEPGGVWTIAPEAVIYLPLTIELHGKIRVVLDVEAALSDAVPAQDVQVRGAKGQLLAETRLHRDASLASMDFTLPVEALSPQGALDLTIEVPDAWVPAQHSDSPDQRLLGVRLRHMRLSEQLATQQPLP